MPKSGESGAVLKRPFARSREYRGEIMVGLTRVEGLRSDSLVITETADAALLARPLRSLADIEEIERVPLGERLRINNFSRRVSLAIAARDPHDTAIHYVPDGNIDRVAERVARGAGDLLVDPRRDGCRHETVTLAEGAEAKQLEETTCSSS